MTRCSIWALRFRPHPAILGVRELLSVSLTSPTFLAECCHMEKASLTIGAVCNGCLVYEQQGQHMVVLVDTPSWYAWLETATTFSFTCEQGTFTAHKARAGNRRGGWYWRAYRRKRGQLSRCYLGVSTNLTLARLCEAAHCLATDGKDTGNSQSGENTPPPVPIPFASQGLTSTVILQSS